MQAYHSDQRGPISSKSYLSHGQISNNRHLLTIIKALDDLPAPGADYFFIVISHEWKS